MCEYPVAQERFERMVNYHQTNIERALKRCDWDKKTQRITHGGFQALADDARKLAAYRLVQGETETAKDLYRKAAITYHTSVNAREGDPDIEGGYIYRTPLVYAKSILLAILADDWDLATDHAAGALKMPTKWPSKNPDFDDEEYKDLPPKRVAYGRALAAVVLDDRGRARTFLADLQAPVPEKYSGDHVFDNEARKPFYEHIHAALTGILQKDPDVVVDALDRYIEEVHEDGWDWDSEVEWATNAYHVTALLKLAHKKGLDVSFESEYVPRELVAGPE